MTSAVLQGVTALSHLGVIRAEGPDAASFLHGQLTQDFALLDGSEARLAALCTAKGRMIASFVGIRPQPELILLVCSRDILAATLKRLSMYVLRAKVKLSDATDAMPLYGLAGSALAANRIDASAAPGRRFAFAVPAVDAAVDAATSATSATVSAVTLYPADGVPRALWISPDTTTPKPVGAELELGLWQWAEVRSGIATLTTPVLDAFVPQMLNYESVGGVNFKKGCYPGQEIVARSQFRGTLKRRAYIVSADAPITVGQEVFAADDAEQPVGTVVQAAASPDGRWSGLVSMQIAALDAGGLHAGAADGPALQVDPLPYPLLLDI
ncbi:MAG: folate-binding protein [Pseudomonadota bacterium]